MARKVQDEPKKGLAGWMGTYGDLVTLLLCFFVLLFSMSSIDVAKFKAAMSSFANQIDIMPGGIALTGEELITNGISQMSEIEIILENKNPTIEDSDDVGDNDSEETSSKSDAYEEAEKMAQEIKSKLVENGFDTEIIVSYNPNYIKMTLSGEMLFDLGKAELRHEAEEILSTIAEIYEENYKAFNLQIEGHTDNLPINTIQYPSNWYLSSARAITVGEFLMNTYGFDPKKINCSGLGEYRPIADNSTKEGRMKNRRVEIKIILEVEEKTTDDIIIRNEQK